MTQRNYFETSHAKGEQDAAGAHVNQRAAMAVVQNEATIQSRHDLYSFCPQILPDQLGKTLNGSKVSISAWGQMK